MVRSGFEQCRGRSPATLCYVLGVVVCAALCVRLRWTLDDAYVTFALVLSSDAGRPRYDSRYVLAEHPAFIAVPPPTLSSYFGGTLAAVKDIRQKPESGRQYALDHWGLRRADVPAWPERATT